MSELKVTVDHLERDAYLYVRQSTLRQVAEMARAPSASTPCVTEQSPRAGQPSVCT